MKSVGRVATSCEEERPGQGQPGQHPVEILGRRRAGPDAGHVAAVLAEVVRLVDGVELDRRIEVREDDDQEGLQEQVWQAVGEKFELMKVCVCGKNWPIVGGNAMIAAAKMIGMTPAMLTRSGM